MKRLKARSIKILETLEIESVTHGNELTPKCGSYGAYTLTTKLGHEFVLWTSMGEVNISEVIES